MTYRGGFVADASRVRGISLLQRLGGVDPTADPTAPVLVSTGGRPRRRRPRRAAGRSIGRGGGAELRRPPRRRRHRLPPSASTTRRPATSTRSTGCGCARPGAAPRAARTSSPCSTPACGPPTPTSSGASSQGRDFVNDDTNAYDDNGHGTWVAGIIAANANDGYGIAGISWTDRILPVKIMNREGTGNTADLLAAIRWSADSGADVINMSVGGFPYSQQMQDAVNYAFEQGRGPRRRGRQQPARGDLLPGELRQRHQRQRDAGRRRVQQLVQLRVEGRRQRSRAHRS